MTRIGIIENPRSQQNQKEFGQLALAARNAGIKIYASLENFEDLGGILKDFANEGVDLLVLSGGDGTVQAALTELTLQQPFETLPRIAIMAGGMTNMTAADVGLSGKGIKGFERLLKVVEGGALPRKLVHRHLLKLENIKDHSPQVGMFFGCAAITRAIESCRSTVHPLKAEAEVASGITLAKLLWRWLTTGRDDDGVLRGDRISIAVDGEELGEKDYLLVLATTLDRLVLKSRPFWNDAGGDFRLTSIAYPPHRLARNAWGVLYGGAERRLDPAHYFSCGTKRIALKMDCPFTLDGQLFDPHPDLPLLLSAEAEADFVRI